MAVTEPVTVIINNCNLLTWPRAMVAEIETFTDLAAILIVDNGSTYPPLLGWSRLRPWCGSPASAIPRRGRP
jgi:hypothetical protein